MAEMLDVTRWNVQRDGDALLICEGDHEKHEGCTFNRYIRADLVDELVKALEVCVVTIERVDTSEGVCCCGDPIGGHSYSSGHSPVDAGDYYAERAVDAAKAALTRIKGDGK